MTKNRARCLLAYAATALGGYADMSLVPGAAPFRQGRGLAAGHARHDSGAVLGMAGVPRGPPQHRQLGAPLSA